MKSLAFSIAFVTAQFALAAPHYFQLDSKVFVDEKLISSPRFTTHANEAAEITQNSESPKGELRMKVIASDAITENVKNGILMKFDVSYRVNGRTLKASPQILAKAGERTSVEVKARDGMPAMKIEVLASRK